MFALFMPIVIAIPFLIAGCIAFILCTAIPALRRFALSASLWCVACIPFLFAEIVIMVLIRVGWEGVRYLLPKAVSFIAGIDIHRISWLGWVLFASAMVIMIAGATLTTILHGWITRRMTLFLFRIYAAAVAAGVGFLGTLLSFVVYNIDRPEMWHTWLLLLLPLFAALFGVLAFYNAAQLRGAYPEFMQVVTPEEYS